MGKRDRGADRAHPYARAPPPTAFRADGTPVLKAKYERRKWHYLVNLPGRNDGTRWLPEHAFTAPEKAALSDLRAEHVKQLTPEQARLVAVMLLLPAPD